MHLLIPSVKEVATQTVVGIVTARVSANKCLKCESVPYSLGLCQRHYRRFKWFLLHAKGVAGRVRVWVSNMREGAVLSPGDSKALRKPVEFVG